MPIHDLGLLWRELPAVQQWIVGGFVLALCMIVQPFRWVAVWALVAVAVGLIWI
jgi:hypothetical protein